MRAASRGAAQALFNRISLVFILSIGTSVVWTVLAGQDLNFDLITYHFYLGYSGFVPRFKLDFLPAWVYAYQSPLPFMPLYWLDSVGTPPVVIAVVHAAFHALALVALYLLTELLLGKPQTVPQRVQVFAFWLLGAAAPIYWTLVGTSFADLLTAVPVLMGVWLVGIGITQDERTRSAGLLWIGLSGLLMGVASGSRIHNSIYVAGMLAALVLARFPDSKASLRVLGTFSFTAFAGWFMSFAPWAYKLYVEFGSPLFPLFNGVFRSPDFPASNVPLLSFIPRSVWDLVTLPFWMATDTPWVYVELPLPDVRPALLATAALACLVLWFGRRWWRPAAAFGGQPGVRDAATARGRHVILLFFLASGVLWLLTSSNGRFGVALLLLAGPVCGVLLSKVLPQRYVILVIAGAVLWQALLQQLFVRQYRFDSLPWLARYFDWNLPDRLSREPAIFLSLGFQPGSTLAPRLHRDSSHINMAGYPAFDAPGSNRIRQLLEAKDRPIYAVFDIRRIDPSIKIQYKEHLALWRLAFTDEPCELITLKPPPASWAWLNSAIALKPLYRPPSFMICALQRSTLEAHEDALRQYQTFATKVTNFGSNCPQYFAKPLGYIRTSRSWVVTSFASAELRLEFFDEGPVYLQQIRPPHVAIEVARITAGEIAGEERDCEKWFSRLSELANQSARRGSVFSNGN